MTGSPSAQRILMVTPYPPVRDGIGSYAVQEVRELRAAGHDVTVLSPYPSAAHQHLDLQSPRGPLALAKRARGYDRTIIQYHTDVFLPVVVTPWRRLLTTLSLVVVFALARRLEVRVHEVDYALGRRRGPNGWAARLLWRLPDQVTVHTEPERAAFTEAYGFPPGRVQLAEHGAHFQRRSDLDQAAARRRLGLPAEGVVFLSIGFIQPHKGFDRAVRAFAGLHAAGAELHVVGSVRVPEPAYLDHLDELRRLCRDTDGAHLHDAYVSDELFDVWLVASDVVVLPYRQIWSSSVMERAALFDRRVIATRVGGLGDQAPPGTTLVDDDAELRDALWAAAGELGGDVPERRTVDWSALHEPAAVQDAIRELAAADRGGAPPLATFSVMPVSHRSGRRATGADGDANGDAERDPLEPLRHLPPLAPPMPQAADPRVALVKKVVRRLTAWEVDPVVHQVNRLRHAVIEALEAGRGVSPSRGDGE